MLSEFRERMLGGKLRNFHSSYNKVENNLWYKQDEPVVNQKKIQSFIKLVLISFRYNELAEPSADTCNKAHCAKLHQWYFSRIKLRRNQTQFTTAEVGNIFAQYLGDHN